MKFVTYKTDYLIYNLDYKGYLVLRDDIVYEQYITIPEEATSFTLQEAIDTISHLAQDKDKYVIVMCDKTITTDVTCKVSNYSFEDIRKCIKYSESVDNSTGYLESLPFLNRGDRPFKK